MTENPPPTIPPAPGSPPPKKRPPLAAFVALGVLAVAVIAVVGWQATHSGDETKPAPTQPSQTASIPHGTGTAFDSADRPTPTFVALEAVEDSSPLFWVDVRDPGATHGVLQKNEWLAKAMKEPLGQGFVAAWSGFFGTRGKDIGAGFNGTVLSFLFEQVLDQPYRITWYGGTGARGAPALSLRNPSGKAKAAFATLVKVAGSGGFNPPACADAGGSTPLEMHRVVLADKTLYGIELGDRLVLSTAPQAVQLAMCQKLEESKARQGVAVSLGFMLSGGGRGTQSLSDLLGIADTVGLDFGVAKDAFVPMTVDAEVTRATLATVEPSEALLKSIPETAGIVLFLAVKLPTELNAAAIREMVSAEKASDKPTVDRQVAVVWSPRGKAGDEVMLLWARAEDATALDTAMNGGNHALQASKACPTLAFATTSAMTALEATCKGSSPSVLQAAAPIVQGLKKPMSFSLTVNLGRVLSQLTLDGYVSEHAGQTTGPEEVESARRLLEELGSFGFTGAVQGNGSLVSTGFKS